jgi:hypothetical protein
VWWTQNGYMRQLLCTSKRKNQELNVVDFDDNKLLLYPSSLCVVFWFFFFIDTVGPSNGT